MRAAKKIGIAGAGMLVIGGAAIAVLHLAGKPEAASTEKIAATPGRLARGGYLVDAVMACGRCHSERDYTKIGGPVAPGGELSGTCPPPWLDFPEGMCMPNLTSDRAHGLGEWSDGEILRAIRDGRHRDGRVLHVMDTRAYAQLSDEDLSSVVVYLRSLPPNPKAVKSAEGGFFSRLLDGISAESAPPKLAADPAEPAKLGEYLVTAAGCRGCHSSWQQGSNFNGHPPFQTPYGEETPVNLTPHQSGLGARTETEFVALFKAIAAIPPTPAAAGNNNRLTMPWLHYGKMADADLGAIYAYLKTLPPQPSWKPQ